MAHNGTSTELTPGQETFLACLLAGHTVQVAAAAAKISVRTAHRWLKQASFQAAYKAAQKHVFETALAGLMLKVEKAVETLDRNMDGEVTPAAVQVRAAQIVLEQATNVHKMNELEQKIVELEKLLTQPPGRNWRVVS